MVDSSFLPGRLYQVGGSEAIKKRLRSHRFEAKKRGFLKIKLNCQSLPLLGILRAVDN
jgi:hypothetical protein